MTTKTRQRGSQGPSRATRKAMRNIESALRDEVWMTEHTDGCGKAVRETARLANVAIAAVRREAKRSAR